jgi:hypothetical protein
MSHKYCVYVYIVIKVNNNSRCISMSSYLFIFSRFCMCLSNLFQYVTSVAQALHAYLDVLVYKTFKHEQSKQSICFQLPTLVRLADVLDDNCQSR